MVTASTPYRTLGFGWMRLATSIASRTESRIPANTRAFTNHVVPKRSANCTTLFVSSSRKAAPMKKRSSDERIARNGPETALTASAEAIRISAMDTR